MTLTLLIPGALDQLTGGYLFARHVVEGLRARGTDIDVIELAGRYPDADAEAQANAAAALRGLADDMPAVIDGLALAGFAPCLASESRRLRLLGWVHHPLADETGLSASEESRFRALETELLPLLRGIICPSRCTGDAVARYGVDSKRIGVAPPGTLKPPHQRRAMPGPILRLLTVATVTPRKAYLPLIEALKQIKRDDWRLDCIGSITRDEAHVARVRRAIAAAGFEARVTLRDEIPQEKLGAAYDSADLFVLPSYHEGYGMALAEALAHGLPVIASNAGAIPELVPPSAGVLVPAGDVALLAAALSQLLDDRDALARLAQGAAKAGAALPDWPQAVTRWHDEIERLLA